MLWPEASAPVTVPGAELAVGIVAVGVVEVEVEDPPTSM
jgi:hypothetical protein